VALGVDLIQPRAFGTDRDQSRDKRGDQDGAHEIDDAAVQPDH
jgi:hypothetical protein